MKQLQGFVRRAAALVLAAVLCLCAPAALAADDAAVSGGAVTMGGANTTLIPAEEENCLSWLFGSGDTITLPYLNIRGQGLKKNVTLNLVDCLVGITYNELGSIGSYVSASAAQQAWKAQAVAAHSYLEYHKQYGSSANALVYTPVDQIPSAAREAIRKAVEPEPPVHLALEAVGVGVAGQVGRETLRPAVQQGGLGFCPQPICLGHRGALSAERGKPL